MQNFINENNLRLFAYTNQFDVKKPICAIVLSFHGLGYQNLKSEPDKLDSIYSERAILSVTPFYGPWSWMNFQAIKLVDEIVSLLIRKYELSRDIPIISTGGSMGGLSALIYARYASITPTACAANCPVCDLPYHSTERDDLPRTMYSAFAHYDCGIDIAMTLHSPMHLVTNMPKIPYYIVHGDKDEAVNKIKHSDRFTTLMKANDHNVTYMEVPGMEHCDFSKSPEVEKEYLGFILSFAK